MQSSTSLRGRLVAALTERLVLKVTAVFLAVALWFVVEKKEPQIELVSVRFRPMLLDSSLVLRDPIPQFQAIVAGAPKDLIRLTSDLPVIRRRIAADAPDTLVLDLRPEDVMLPDGVNAIVRDIQPRSVTLRFEPTRSRSVRIDASGIEIVPPHEDGRVRAVVEPETVQISGPRHLVVRIQSVRTVNTKIPYPDSLTHLVDLDTTALGPAIRVRPTQVSVHLLVSPHA